MNNGWIKLHRKFMNHPDYKDIYFKSLWIHILLKANHEDYKTRWNGKIKIIGEGQFISTIPDLAKECNITYEQARLRIRRMIDDGSLHRLGTARKSLWTVQNWKEHQSNGTGGAQVGHSCIKQEDKEIKEVAPPSEIFLTSEKQLLDFVKVEVEKGVAFPELKKIFKVFGFMFDLGYKLKSSDLNKDIEWCKNTIRKNIGISQENGEPMYHTFEEMAFNWHTYWSGEKKKVKNHKASLLKNIQAQMSWKK